MGIASAIGLGVVGSVVSSNSNRRAAQTAADTSLSVAQENNALAREFYGRNEANLRHGINRGNWAGGTIAGMLGLHTNQDYNDRARNRFAQYIDNSDYAFQFGEGANAVNSGYAGAGTLQSGAAMRGLEDYRQNLQAGYRNEYMNALAGQDARGLQGAGALAGVGVNTSNAMMANNTNAGNAAANAALVRGANNPFGNALGMIGGTILEAYS